MKSTGTARGISQLPIARVKKIIKEDKDVQIVSNEAVFLISIATEIFLEGFTAKAFNLAKLEKRKTVLYKDLATAVTQYDSLEFLKTYWRNNALPRKKEESGAMEEEDEGEQETNEQSEDSDEEQQQSASEDVNSSRPMSDDDEDFF
ncbi:MAG: histone-fold-containing protein [Benniella sp.]|nr:MAG: histone-fold-containing protein [Benniella sp.]